MKAFLIGFIAVHVVVAQPCITPQQYAQIEQQCTVNIKALGLSDKHDDGIQASVKLQWPLRAAKGVKDCDVYFVSAYVDQDPATGAVKDFDCKSNTYDGHHGTDIAVWPYGFYKMENNVVEVVAAAGGTIVQKADGNYDRNCGASNLTANSVIVLHNDGSQALYWHMKSNSVTTKKVGDTVEAGEYLGVVGSSGSSSGPHLHFEVWSSNQNTTYIDPYEGTCNLLNATTWWESQKPHKEPSVLKVSANTTDNVFPPCPETETPNEADEFVIPFQGPELAPGFAKFYVFFRNEKSGLNADCRILNQAGAIYMAFLYTSTVEYNASYWGTSKKLPTTPGEYTFQATYNGVTCSTPFKIKTGVDVHEPFEDDFSMSSCTIDLYDIIGQSVVQHIPITEPNYAKQLASVVTEGLYLYRITDNEHRIVKSGVINIER